MLREPCGETDESKDLLHNLVDRALEEVVDLDSHDMEDHACHASREDPSQDEYSTTKLATPRALLRDSSYDTTKTTPFPMLQAASCRGLVRTSAYTDSRR